MFCQGNLGCQCLSLRFILVLERFLAVFLILCGKLLALWFNLLPSWNYQPLNNSITAVAVRELHEVLCFYELPFPLVKPVYHCFRAETWL